MCIFRRAAIAILFVLSVRQRHSARTTPRSVNAHSSRQQTAAVTNPRPCPPGSSQQPISQIPQFASKVTNMTPPMRVPPCQRPKIRAPSAASVSAYRWSVARAPSTLSVTNAGPTHGRMCSRALSRWSANSCARHGSRGWRSTPSAISLKKILCLFPHD